MAHQQQNSYQVSQSHRHQQPPVANGASERHLAPHAANAQYSNSTNAHYTNNQHSPVGVMSNSGRISRSVSRAGANGHCWAGGADSCDSQDLSPPSSANGDSDDEKILQQVTHAHAVLAFDHG